MSHCQPTYPAKTLMAQLTKVIKEEENLDVACHISGRTLWVYVPLTDLLEEKEVLWNTKGIEKMNKALSVVHRAILSTDAPLDFIAVVAADVERYGVELIAIEYISDIKEAILERFSRGEFFARSVRDVTVNPDIVGDLSGERHKYYNIPFDHFLGLQIIHRTKSLFLKDAALKKIFELRSTAVGEKFGVIRIDLEFIKRTYDLSPEEEKINPLDRVTMVAAQVVRNYDYKDFQAVELADTFANETKKLTPADLRKVKIQLPAFDD